MTRGKLARGLLSSQIYARLEDTQSPRRSAQPSSLTRCWSKYDTRRSTLITGSGCITSTSHIRMRSSQSPSRQRRCARQRRNPMPDRDFPRPSFIDAVGHSYNRRGKRVILLTGNVLYQFWSPPLESFNSLEQTLYQELNTKFLMLRVDAASGMSFYDAADEQELLKICQLADRIATRGQGLGDVQEKIAQTQHQPLPMLILLRGMSNAATRLWTGNKNTYKPLCVMMQF